MEECQIKLSSAVSDLLGSSGQRILCAIAAGETDPTRLKALGDKRLHATDEELRDALNGQPQPLHRRLLKLYLERLNLIEGQIAELESMIAEAMKAHQDAVVRLSQLPGLGVDSAQQIIAEIALVRRAFRQLGNWRHGWECAPESRRAWVSPAATGPLKGTVRCAAC